MEAFFIRALQLILSLSILVVLHEFGHFAFARLFKVRVEKFYMFFNPNFSLIRAKKINGKWDIKFFAKNVSATERPVLDADGDAKIDAKGKTIMEQIPVEELPEGHWHKYPENTEWGIGWLPLGGYCSIAGMVDETKDVSQMAAEPQPWEYRSRSVWQRLPIIVGGVFVNFILAMVIYSAVLYTWGEEYLPLQNAKYGLQFSKILQENGFKNGDKIISIDGQAVEKQSDVIEKILIEGKQNIKVARDSQQIDIQLPADLTQSILRAGEKELVGIRQPFVIAELSKGMGAEAAKLQVGDSVVGLNGKQLSIFQDIADELAANKDKQINVDYVRKGVLLHSLVKVDENGKLGVAPKDYTDFMQTKRTEYGFLAAIPAGVNLGWQTLTSYVKQFKIVFTKEGSKQMGGFGTIGKLFPKVWDWHVFWMLTAFLSIILAFMNLLPIPALDGGYVMFLIYEMITGKKPNDKFLEYAQTAGFFLLMALLIYVNGNDIFKAIFK